jgi:hypothetical protein
MLDSKRLWKSYPILLDKALAIGLPQYRAAALQRLRSAALKAPTHADLALVRRSP